MKRILSFLVVVSFVAFGFLGTAQALSNSGEFMFIVEGNDKLATMQSIEPAAEQWFLNEKGITRDVDFQFYQKIDEPAKSASGMQVTYEPDKLSGTWMTALPIEFYTVKASPRFALYWVAGGATSGTWSTEHILNGGCKQPTISHVSSWNPLDRPPSVPEPSVMLLLGTGLICLVGLGRRVKR